MGITYGMVGETRETLRGFGVLEFEWSIKGHALPMHKAGLVKTGFCFWSPVTRFQDQPWRMSISPSCEVDGEEYIGMFLWGHRGLKPVRYTFCVKYHTDREEEASKDQMYPDTGTCCVLIKCLPRSELLKYGPESLTLKCFLWIDDAISNEAGNQVFSQFTQAEPVVSWEPETTILIKNEETKGVATLQKHLKDLLLRNENHDVTIKVKGKVFKAHKVILGARSPVFAAMLAPKEEKPKSNHLSIEDCNPDAFGEFLQYLYTGKLESFTPDTAMGIHFAAEKFELTELKEQCVEYLQKSMTSVNISDVIKFAASCSEGGLYESAVTFFTDNMEEVLGTREWKHFFTTNPEQANELYLKALQTNYRKIK